MGLRVVSRPPIPVPSPRLGGRDALRLWRLVVAGWLLPSVVFLPLWLVLDTATADLDQLPLSGVAPGDMELTVMEGQAGLVRPLLWAAAAGFLLTWAWGVLWRGSVVGWKLWVGGATAPLGPLLGYGLLGFWRYLRLALVSGLALGFGLAAVWSPALVVLLITGEAPPVARLWGAVLVGGVGTLSVTVAVTLASLRGAWLLGRADRRSAVAAWLRGLDGAIRQPGRSVVTLLVWWSPTWVAAALPLLVLWWVPSPAEPAAVAVLLQLSLLVRSACRTALLASFAPTAGLPFGER